MGNDDALQDEQRQTARDFWVKQSQQKDVVRAVHPHSMARRYHEWTRGLLQTWTLARARADRPRYKRLVDLGCGFGDWTELLAPLADEVHGCEIAPTFAELARQRVPHATITCSDLQSYVMPDQVDLVYIGAVLLYLSDEDVRDVLRRIRAAAAPGALILWREYCTFNFGRRTVNKTSEHFSIHRTPAEVCELAREAGFEILEMRSSPSIYAEVHGGTLLQWPLRAAWRLATVGWTRASHTLVLRAP